MPFGYFLLVIPVDSRTAARLAQSYFDEAAGLFQKSMHNRGKRFMAPIEISVAFIGTVRTSEDLETVVAACAIEHSLDPQEAEAVSVRL